MQESTLTYSVDHTVLESRVNLQRLEPCRELENILFKKRIIK
nr:MAG TPA: hypothetical protein [Caudoviricetes sp.]